MIHIDPYDTPALDPLVAPIPPEDFSAVSSVPSPLMCELAAAMKDALNNHVMWDLSENIRHGRPVGDLYDAMRNEIIPRCVSAVMGVLDARAQL